MQCYTNVTSAISTGDYVYPCYCCFNSYSAPFTADITADTIAISNLEAGATAKSIF